MTTKLTWARLGYGSQQYNGSLELGPGRGCLFTAKPIDGGWLLKTSLPNHFRLGAFGATFDSLENAQAEAEEVLKDFYSRLKKAMEPAKPAKRAAVKGKC